MQVTQTLAEGLKREFKVVVPAADLASRANAQLEEMKDKVRINGFRPGKVPVAHLKRLYGRSVMADIVNTMVGEANKKIVDDNHIKLAMEPKLDFEGGDDGVTSVLEGKADFAWTVSVEVLPSFEVGDLSVLLEQLQGIRIGDDVRSNQLRHRYLTIVLDGLHLADAPQLPSTPPTWQETSGRY